MLQPAQTRPLDISPEFVQQLQSLAEADNLVDALTDTQRGEVARKVIDYYEIDQGSMSDWVERMEHALNLAMLVKGETKTTPWENASNIHYPLITTAALQYNARAYPAIVPATDVVKVSVQGKETPQKVQRGKRVAEFMSHQLKFDSKDWERGTDQLSLQLSIVADVFRKLWWCPVENKIKTQIRLPGKHVVINNNCTTMQDAPRVSDLLKYYPHQIETEIRSGTFSEFTYDKAGEDDQKPQKFIEQVLRCDLDEDGYDEPYIATVHKETQTLVRLVTAWDMSTIRIQGSDIVSADTFGHFIHYQFMPSMDGGFFGTGMGLLLGDVSDTINSTLNMMMDSGKLASLGGGFIGAQNFRVKGGVTRMRPGEYKHINFTGDDIRKGLVPLDFPGPSPVLFQVLGLMMDAGREIASVSDIMTGETHNANLPVGTVMALIEQGHQVFTASYKRIYRALLEEFELIARLNQKNLPPEKYNAFLDDNDGQQPIQHDPARDFDLADMDIKPVADPQSVTSMQKMGKAQFTLELAGQGLVDPAEATRRALDAAQVDNPDALMPKPNPQQQAMQMASEEMLVLDIRLKEAELDEMQADTMKKLAEAEKISAEADLAPLRAKIDNLRAWKEGVSARREEIEAGIARRMERKSGNAGASANS